MDIFDIFLDILLKPPQPLMGLFLSLIRLGLSCHLVEILHLMCSSLWNISLVLELHFHWILGIFIRHEHVVYHVYHH